MERLRPTAAEADQESSGCFGGSGKPEVLNSSGPDFSGLNLIWVVLPFSEKRCADGHVVVLIGRGLSLECF